MKTSWFYLMLALVLAGCAQQPPASRGQDSERMEAASPRARIHTELAAQYYMQRQYSVALQEVREAIQSDAGYAPAYNILGLVHAALLEDKEAEANFRRSIELAPQYSEAHNNYGYFLCSRQRRAEAMQHFEQAWKNPLYAMPERALANAGHCALKSGDLVEAEGYARRALIRVDNQPQALVTLAEIQYRRGNIAAARTVFQQLEAQGSLDPSALWLAVKLERRGDNRVAEANYGLQLRRNYPDSQEAGWLLNGQYDMPGGKQ
ncbi:MAG: type IV pilus biogenesis/stability protein PilW [Hydrogenophilaceae bacterium]